MSNLRNFYIMKLNPSPWIFSQNSQPVSMGPMRLSRSVSASLMHSKLILTMYSLSMNTMLKCFKSWLQWYFIHCESKNLESYRIDHWKIIKTTILPIFSVFLIIWLVQVIRNVKYCSSLVYYNQFEQYIRILLKNCHVKRRKTPFLPFFGTFSSCGIPKTLWTWLKI